MVIRLNAILGVIDTGTALWELSARVTNEPDTYIVWSPCAQVGVLRIPQFVPILTVGQNPQQTEAQPGQQPFDPTQSPQQQQQAQQQQFQRPAALKAAAKSKYYAKLFVNGHYVDVCSAVALGEDFQATFREIFRWGWDNGYSVCLQCSLCCSFVFAFVLRQWP